eukprot:10970722-Alexandrium_andersonii.AAC.1
MATAPLLTTVPHSFLSDWRNFSGSSGGRFLGRTSSAGLRAKRLALMSCSPARTAQSGSPRTKLL